MPTIAEEQGQFIRALHWVLKIGSLKTSLDFFEGVLGLKVLRHEEFESGCEATCNGPYAGAWSKTMIGYGPESHHFALELTYNYGIESYQNGNDLQYIAVACDGALERAAAMGYAVDQTTSTITGPDAYKYCIVPQRADTSEAFACVALRVDHLDAAKAYWCGVLGMTEFESALPGCEATHVNASAVSSTVGFNRNGALLQLIQVNDGAKVDHALASGRIAFACKSVEPIFQHIQTTGDAVQVPPLTLPTPGKADVVVTILRDRDGYEICFVEDDAFYALATPTYDVVDFAARAAKGGDGHPPPKAKLAETHGTVQVHTKEEVDAQVAAQQAAGKVLVVEMGAGWCKKCVAIAPKISELADTLSSSLAIVTVDIDDCEDEVSDMFGVKSVPAFALYSKQGELSEIYRGSDEEVIKAKINALVA